MQEIHFKCHNTVTQCFEAQVRKSPLRIALQDQNHQYLYSTLNERANQFAYWLRQNSVKPGDFVAILLEPNSDFILCILAIIKLGAVYAPLDFLAPPMRLTGIINDANPKLIITDETYQKQLQDITSATCLVKHMHLESMDFCRDNLNVLIQPDDPIYLMYTSGSTGKPKGVLIPHHAVVNLAKIDNLLAIDETHRVAQFSNLAFDGCTFEIWPTLFHGARLCVVPNAVRSNAQELRTFLHQHEINCLFLPTGYFHQLIKSFPETIDSVLTVMVGGEQVNLSLLKNFLHFRKIKKCPIILLNCYGPTEATTVTCRHVLTETSSFDDEELISIGKPITEVKTYVLDKNFHPTMEGELYISGINLAIGYHNDPSQTQEKFLANPFESEAPFTRLYKTGDRVKILPSGKLRYLGRLDDQVKIGGFRIHLNEIEQELMNHESIALATVVVEKGGESHQMLTAYMVCNEKKPLDSVEQLRQFLGLRLPSYMLPNKYLLIDELPLTLTGKVDKKKLNTLLHTPLLFHAQNSSASTIEETIKQIWQRLLNHSSIETHKNLFELGANSLLITEACSIINNTLQKDLQISDLLTYPTIHGLSCFIEGDVALPFVKKQTATSSSSHIAVIGMSCRFPQANSIQEFWDNLCQGKISLEPFENESPANFVPVRGALCDIEQFDAPFFGFSPKDASITDPQVRLFLECAWEAIEHANIVPSKYSDKAISVFAGMTDSTYLHENLLKNSQVRQELDSFQQRIATSIGMLSTQVSYRLNLKGSSLNINTACSTGLVTVTEACQELSQGKSDIALAGAVSIVVPQKMGYQYQQGGIQSPDGQCRPFEETAQGTVFSNGIGIVILKRLEEAIADNNTIYAVIKGCAINNDGSDKLGYTAPSVHGQMACIREALDQAKITAEEIGYLEAHGTATALGDVIEIDALSKVYQEQTDRKQYCALGSVKRNIGHTDVAAGMSGLIKTILCLYHQKIPPMPQFDKPNPALQLEESPFFINSQLIDWPNKPKHPYAGVSSFGVGGTNAHLILTAFQADLKPTKTTTQQQLLVLSAKTEYALQGNKEKLASFFENQEKNPSAPYLEDIAYSLQTGREAFRWRCIAVGLSTPEIKLRLLESKPFFYDGNSQPKIVFLFPGQGLQYHYMAMQLMDEVPFFASLVLKGIQFASAHLEGDLLAILSKPDDPRLHQTQYSQPILFIIEYALAKLLMHYGMKPEALIGHSLGEYVAACLAGVFSFEDAIALVCQRGLLMASVSEGSMLVVEQLPKDYSGLDLALHNSPSQYVLSGNPSAIHSLETSLKHDGKLCRILNTKHAFHSQSMEEIEQSFQALFSTISLSAPQIPIISNVTGTWLSSEEATSPSYWYRHMRHTVEFCKGLETLLADPGLFYIEVGPGQSLTNFLRETANLAQKKVTTSTTLVPNQQTTEHYQVLQAMGLAWQQGIVIDWSKLHEKNSPKLIALPTYTFQKQRYWVEPDNATPTNVSNLPMMYRPVLSKRAFARSVSLSNGDLSQHCWIVFKDKAGLGDSLINILNAQGIRPVIITVSENYTEIDQYAFTLNLYKKEHYIKLINTIRPIAKKPILLHLSSYGNVTPASLSKKDIEEQLATGFYSLLYFTQAYIQEMGEQELIKINVISSGTQKILGTENINPINASLLGACRVIAQEQPSCLCKVIDLDELEEPHANSLLLHKIIESCLEAWEKSPIFLSYRQGYQWQQSYQAIQKQVRFQKRLKDKGVYLLTGGLGGIALTCCKAIAKTVSNPTFVLLSRRKFHEESVWDIILEDPDHADYQKTKSLHQLKELGATIVFYQVDIGQYQPLQEKINECLAHFGALHGIIHTAGISSPELVQFESKENAEQVFLPKLHGTFNLAKALAPLSLDFIVLHSSLAALLGGFCQMSYAASNSCLDAFVSSGLFSNASFVSTINWNTWREVGMAAVAAQQSEASFLGMGNDIAPQEGQDLFLDILQGEEPSVAISKIGIDLEAPLPSDEIPAPSIAKVLREHLHTTAAYQAPTSKLESQLISLWEEMLGVQGIGIDDDFFALGGHSLKALSLIEKINRTFACSLPSTQLYHHATIRKLSQTMTDIERKEKNPLVLLKPGKEDSPALFLCHPISGLLLCFNAFVSQMSWPGAIYGLQDPSIDATNMVYKHFHGMAEDYLMSVRKCQPSGPYFFMGYSFGGNLVYEIASQLKQEGEEIGLLALIDSWAIHSPLLQNESLFKTHFQSQHQAFSQELLDLSWEREKLLLNHSISQSDQDILLFKASELTEEYQSIDHPKNGWCNHNKGKILCHTINGTHNMMLSEHNSSHISAIIEEHLKERDETIQTEPNSLRETSGTVQSGAYCS